MFFLLAGLLASSPCALAAGQAPALVEDFNLAVPPAGWTHVQTNPLAAGWIHSLDGRAWHQDESTAVGTCEDLLTSPTLDLTAFAKVYAHFSIELAFANYLANCPGSAGDGETDLYLRVNGGPWVEVWTETRQSSSNDILTVDLTAWAAHKSGVEIALRYYGTFAHATWVDWIQVDADPLPPPPPPPPPVVWNVSLPLSSLALAIGVTLSDDFEAYAGILPPHMAATRVFASSGLPDPEAWCDIAGAFTSGSGGLRCLEMGLVPGTVNYHNARNALVLAYDGSGTDGLNELSFRIFNFGEEVHPFDGAWISTDGNSWYRVFGPWTGLPAAWTQQTVDLRAVRHLTSQPFFLMLAQEDNFPYATLDGIGLDDLALVTAGNPGPSLSKSGNCPGALTFTVANATPSRPVAFFYGRPGTTVQSDPQDPCLGLIIDIQRAKLGGFRVASTAGTAILTTSVPSLGCGMRVQAVDVSTCQITDFVTL